MSGDHNAHQKPRSFVDGGIDRETVIALAREAGGLDLLCASYGFMDTLAVFANLVVAHERERIKQANAPEIEKINAYIKALEEAVLAEREACAKVCDNTRDDEYTPGSNYECAAAIRSRK